MRASFIAAALALAGSSLGAAVEKRQAQSGGTNIDATVLNFALILEHLESTFYSTGLQNYSAQAFTSAGYSTAVRDNLVTIAGDEATHVSVLTSALSAAGATPAQACQYAFPVTDPKSFLAVAQVLEGVGVAAYSGAAPLITSPDYLEAAANILTVEARHSAFINLASGRSPFPAPFDKGITPTSITTLAAPFFASCPSGSAPPFVPFPKLAVTNAANATQGSQLSIQANTTLAAQGATLYCNFVYGGGQAASPFTNNACTVPSNVTNGQTFVYISNSQGKIADNSTIAGPAILELGAVNQTVLLQSSGTGNGGASGNATGGQTTTASGGSISSAVVSKAGAFGALFALGLFVL